MSRRDVKQKRGKKKRRSQLGSKSRQEWAELFELEQDEQGEEAEGPEFYDEEGGTQRFSPAELKSQLAESQRRALAQEFSENRRARNKRARLSQICGYVMGFLLNFVSIIFIYYLSKRQFLPNRIQYPLIGLVLILNTIVDLIFIFRRSRPEQRRSTRALAYVLSAVLIVFFALMSFVYGRLDQTINQLSSNKKIIRRFSLIVHKDDPAQDVGAVQGQSVGAVTQSDAAAAQHLLSSVGASQIQDSPSYQSLVRDLLGKKQRFILLNESYRSLIEDVEKSFAAETRILKTYEFDPETPLENRLPVRSQQGTQATHSKRREELHAYEAGAAIDGNSPFLVYVSGNDTYGKIDEVSRSDVNLILAVNPETHRILIVTVPRDAYLPIAGEGGGYYDKLTHAGLYGVEASQQTLSNLFGLGINGYVRINFSSLIHIVDSIGGIDVDNPVDFTAKNGKHFPKGRIHLLGKDALTFSRERYGLEGGDFDRGRNQERVLKAAIEKMMAPAQLLNFNKILSVIGSSIDMNIPGDALTTIVRRQLEDSSSWQIDMDNVGGEGSLGVHSSYLMPDYQLYMVDLDEDSVARVKARIEEVLGRSPSGVQSDRD